MGDHNYVKPHGRKWTRKVCCVPKCTSQTSPIVSLHKVPSSAILRSEWTKLIDIRKQLPFKPFICSAHFTDDYFIKRTEEIKRRRLKREVCDSSLPIEKKWRSRKICFVPQCFNRASSTISLHKFPRSPVLCYEWTKLLQIDKILPKNAFVCSSHFADDCFIKRTDEVKRRRLRHEAMPTLNLPLVSRKQSSFTPRFMESEYPDDSSGEDSSDSSSSQGSEEREVMAAEVLVLLRSQTARPFNLT